MASVVIAAAVGAAVVLVAPRVWAVVRGWRRGRSRQVECTGCGRSLPVGRAVSVGETFAADDGGLGGTAVTTDWHKRCARKAGVS